MPLLNYTTQVGAERSVAEIQRLLAQAGALAIMTEFSNGTLTGITFKIATPFGPASYTLPCNIPAVRQILERQSRAGKIPRRFVTDEQAARVGWRIIKDWVEAQIAIIQTQMVSLDQVFLPFARTPSGETVYERYVNSGMAGLALK